MFSQRLFGAMFLSKFVDVGAGFARPIANQDYMLSVGLRIASSPFPQKFFLKTLTLPQTLQQQRKQHSLFTASVTGPRRESMQESAPQAVPDRRVELGNQKILEVS